MEKKSVKYYYGTRLGIGFAVWILSMHRCSRCKIASRPPTLCSFIQCRSGFPPVLSLLLNGHEASIRNRRTALKDSHYHSSLSILRWGPAFPIMFVFHSDDDPYEVLGLDKRAIFEIGTGIVSSLENITLACEAFRCSAL